MRVIVAVLVLLVACGKSKEACKAEVDDLMTYLRSLDLEGQAILLDDSTQLVLRAGTPRPKQGAPVVALQGGKTLLSDESAEGARVVAGSDLAGELGASRAQLVARLERYPGRHPRDLELVYVAISGETTWDRIVASAQAAAEAGFVHVSFVFALPPGPPPPPRTWVEDRIDALQKKGVHGGEMAQEAAKAGKGIVESCPALVKLYGAVTPDDGKNKAVTIVEGTGPALIDCNCKADVPALRSMMYAILAMSHPVGVIDVKLAKDGKAIELPASTTWTEAETRITSGEVVWLVAR
jgi:hypothetical protein